MADQVRQVILDTDIGDDIDDTWALAMLLKLQELDLKLVVSDTDDTWYRGKLLAKMLEIAGRTDIPVGIGLYQCPGNPRQAGWVENYDLNQYPGTVHEDGVGALIDTIMSTDKPISLICIGPMPNILAALEREPRIAPKTDFVGMHGSLSKNFDNAPGQIAEYNVVEDIAASQKVFTANWNSITITPLDTCGSVRLGGQRYAQLLNSDDKLTQAVLDNYRIWAQGNDYDPETGSSILFDTVAVHLAYSTKYLKMKQMGIRVDDAGFMRTDGPTKQMNVAIDWQDYQGYLDYLTALLLA